MRMSRLFSQTQREAPGESDEVASQRLLVRAGFIRQLAAGIYSLLPLGKRAVDKIEAIIREEMDAIGGQEMAMPVVHPADLWKESGRWYQIGSEMGRFVDKNERDMVLAMTHEEVVADLVRREIRSYRQLPCLVYHLQTKWRDDPRPRAGLIRVREFTMKDSYSLDADLEGLDLQYRRHYQAYFDIFHRCGLEVIAVGADVGMMGGSEAHEFMYLAPVGEDTLVLCDACGYSANQQIARFARAEPAAEAPLPLERVATPGATTIEALTRLLDIPASRTAKAVFMVATPAEGEGQRFVFAVVGGDREVNQTKLANAIRARELRPAREEEIRAVGAEPGYGSPIGVREALVVVDELIPRAPNLVAGANEVDAHYRNVNYGRDFSAEVVADIVDVREGDACPRCGAPLRLTRGVEVGNIFKLGTRFTEPMGGQFLDRDGQLKPVIMGSYGIGVGRLLACVAEAHHDEKGLRWPASVAPYDVHLVLLAREAGTARLTADQVYTHLQGAGLAVLYDDREESPGIKFNDADLIGLPLRLTVSERSLTRGGVELKARAAEETEIIPVDEVVDRVQRELTALKETLARRVVTIPYRE